ncbi:lytic transglycosylase domain-containing protein [Tepidiforma sp.]|uniref:lytic transglycosylase domain-containing protein n=1 Tax=Tepidiforma sp. TaxID=2682230 RepID=UPI0026137B4A|nr:lytic transglycosylase domain-containing protein [Tepidiforma sp.]MCX7617965.1 lytic transglycosylase domain-containing protein [Tepidiforma sp.]
MKAGRNRAAWGGFVLLCSAVVVAAGAVEWASRDGGAPAAPGGAPGPGEPAAPPAAASPSPTAGAGPVSPALAEAEARLREGRFDEALAGFEAAARAASSPSAAGEAWFGAGRAAEELGERGQAIDAFRAALAAAPAGSELADRAAYRLLRALNDAGRTSEALAVPAPAGGGVIAAYARFERGRALAAAGDTAAAAAAWEAAAADTSLAVPVRAAALAGLAGLARDAGDDAALARWLDARVALDGSPAARYERALVARRLDDAAGFERGLRELMAAAPLSREATLAIADLEAAGFAVDPGQAGFILYRRGAYAEAVRLLSGAAEEPGIGAAERTFRAYYLAAALEELGRFDEAVRWYDAAAATGAASPFVHRAKYWAARVLETSGRSAEAAERYLALAVEGPPGEFSREAAFRAGYGRYVAGDIAGALAAWEAAQAAASPRLEYWRGRALEALGRPTEAADAYRRAAALDRFDFFAIEAAARLGDPVLSLDVGYRPRDLARGVDWEAVAAWLRGRVGGDWPGSAPTAACALARAGLSAEAAAELERAAAGADAWRLLELAREARECGLGHLALGYAVRLRQAAGAAPWEAPPDLLRVAYPVDYPAALDRAAASADVDPLFLAALVRAESLWDPRAGSGAGALGLTQVIPPTGEGIARALGFAGFEPADLFRPAVSLEFGAYYLGVQLRRFGDPLLALAAYNAGPGNALRWAAGGDAGAAALAERIDFSETQAYVRVIVEAYAYYRLAWAE